MANPYQIGSHISRDDSELYSYNERSYNSWQYGDEASLYSIAEDSREDRASEVPSMAGTENASSITQGAAVEMRWAEEVEEEESDENPSSAMSSMNDPYYSYQPTPRRKYILIACAVGIFMVAVISAVAASLNNGDDAPRSNVGEGVADNPPVTKPTPATPAPVAPTASPPPPTLPPQEIPPVSKPQVTEPPAPTAAPSTAAPTTASPTVSPTHSGEYKMADGLVFSALYKCAPPDRLEDPSTIEGKVYQNIVSELYAEVFTSSDGFVNYPLRFGIPFIQEKYALGVLYETTNGDEWMDNDGWLVESDPCDGWNGIVNCRSRREGSCGVVHINLNANSLAGFLPEALCCLPCLETLSMSDNQLKGTIPQCMSEMGAVMNLENNSFAQETSAELSKWP